jgi:hypothetical protein
VTSGAARRAGKAASSTQVSAEPCPARACTASNTSPGLVTHTTSAVMSCSANRSAATSASGTIAPIAAIVTSGAPALRRSG